MLRLMAQCLLQLSHVIINDVIQRRLRLARVMLTDTVCDMITHSRLGWRSAAEFGNYSQGNITEDCLTPPYALSALKGLRKLLVQLWAVSYSFRSYALEWWLESHPLSIEFSSNGVVRAV